MLISELAARTNVAIHTIRFYEKEGLLDDRFFERGENRYRYYREEAVERVEMIRHGQAAGFTLSEVRDLLLAWDAGELTTGTQIAYLEEKLAEITARIDELEQIRRYLSGKVTRMQAAQISREPTTA